MPDEIRRRSIISILEVPSGTVHMARLRQDGGVEYKPAVLVAYTTYDDLIDHPNARDHQGLPFIYPVYSCAIGPFVYWESESHANKRSGRCGCEDKRCRELGITYNGREVDSEVVTARLAALSKLPKLKQKVAAVAHSND